MQFVRGTQKSNASQQTLNPKRRDPLSQEKEKKSLLLQQLKTGRGNATFILICSIRLLR